MRDYKVVATKSTVPVGTAKRIKERIQAAQSEPIGLSVVSNPEFLLKAPPSRISCGPIAS